MPDVRLIDANALIKDIAESIKLADEWEAESHKKLDKHGLKCAIDTRRALLSMISRVKDAPTVEAIPSERWKELKDTIIVMRDNGGTGTQEVVCKFLVNLMGIIERENGE